MLKSLSGNLKTTLCIACILLICFPAIYLASRSPVVAGEGIQVHLRVVGPADDAAFTETGEYQLIWAGDITVPLATNITSTSGNTWQFSVENTGGEDRYIVECVAGAKSGERHDRGEADGIKGATSVLAALVEASQQGSFSCGVNDNWFPGIGMFVGSIGGYTNSGAVGWNYRVWNPDEVYAPSVSSDMFLLGYDSTPLSLPHEQVLWFWGATGSCHPLRVTLSETTVQAGEEFTATVEYYQEFGWSGTGDWNLLPEAVIEVASESFTTDDNGEVNIYLEEEGSYSITASKRRDGASYYVPSDESLQVHVSGGTADSRWTATSPADFSGAEQTRVVIADDVRLERGGTISDNYTLDSAVDTIGGEYFYNEFKVINGSTLNVAPGEILTIHANYIEVDGSSRIDADGRGYSGGTGSTGNGNDGFGVGGGSGAVNWNGCGGGGGGAGYREDGGAGSYGTSVNATGGAAGYSYGKICTTGDDSFYTGSGGGAGAGDGAGNAGGSGGNGGGAVALESMSSTDETSIVIDGDITVNGDNGDDGVSAGCGGGGGGSGGTILIKGKNIDIASGTLSVAAGGGGDKGGAGGGGGGGGTGGYIKVFYENCNNSDEHDISRGYGGDGDPYNGADGKIGAGSEKQYWYDYLSHAETYSPVLPYYESGTLVSPAYDTGCAANFTAIQWSSTLFSGTGIKFQIAANNDNATWNFTGPDGTAGTYYQNSGTDIWSGHDGNRYIKYKAFLTTTEQGQTPVLNKVSIGYTAPPEIISFSVIDYGDHGINFGVLAVGSTNNPEAAQNSSRGAVMLVVAAETTVNCAIQIKSGGDFSDGAGNSIPLYYASWGSSSEPGTASNMTADYVTVSTSTAAQEKSVDIWHWVGIPAGQEPAIYETYFYYRAVKQ